MVQWIKHVPCKCEGWRSLDSRTHDAGWVWWPDSNSRAEKVIKETLEQALG